MCSGYGGQYLACRCPTEEQTAVARLCCQAGRQGRRLRLPELWRLASQEALMTANDMGSWPSGVGTNFSHGQQLLCLQGQKWDSVSQSGHQRLGQVISEAASGLAWDSALEFISRSRVGSSLPCYSTNTSLSDSLSWTGGLRTHSQHSLRCS